MSVHNINKFAIIYSSFSNAVSGALNERMTVKNELEKMWKQTAIAYF